MISPEKTTSTSGEMSESDGIFNPFPGLRPFRYEESHLYFGREEQIGEVLDKLIENHFVAIIGTSGIGKSSFINCGILPILFKDYKTSHSSKWEVFNFRPGNTPLDNLIKAFLKEEIMEAQDDEAAVKIFSDAEEKMKGWITALVELASEKYKKSQKNILIYIDQFEEIFRYREKHEDADEVSTFLNLLIVAISQSKVPIYVAITMRSDFVGDCARYPEFTDKINDSQFLIPQMTRDEKSKAIVGPVETVNATIDDKLVQKILDDVGDDADSLPVMQHAMMRTYDYWAKNSFSSDEISVAHYAAIGGMEEALSIHANEAFYELNEDQQQLCEKIFKTITEKGGGGRGTRRPTRLADIATVTDASIEEVMEIVEHFRAAGRTLLMPPYNIPLTEESMVDISHESLMRIWTNLSEWVEDEFESAKLYLRLCEAAEMHQLGKAGLWRPPDLQLALAWRESQKPTLSWGLRYDPGFERAMLFLDYSEKEYEKEQVNKQKMQKRRLFIARIAMAFFGLLALVALGFFLYGLKQQEKAEEQRANALVAQEKAEESAEVAKQESIKADSARRTAEKERLVAVAATQRAKVSAQEAMRQAEIARLQSIKADSARGEALAQKDIADEARAGAYNLRLLSIARSMAVKSVQLPDTTQKGLVAQQAYIFNTENGGNPLDPDIYNGLYNAVKDLQGSSYNKLLGHSDNVRVIVQGAGNQIYSTGSDGQVLKWNISADSPSPIKLPDYAKSLSLVNKSMVLSKDKRWLAIGGDYTYVQLFDLMEVKKNKQAKPKLLTGKIRSSWYLAFTPDNKLISVGADKKIVSWDLDNNFSEIASSDVKINSIVLSPDGSKIAAAKINGQVTIFDLKNGNKETVFYRDPQGIDFISITFSKDGRFLAAGNEVGQVRVWDFKKKTLRASLSGHTARINNIKFSNDGKKLATGSFDATVRIWNVESLNDQPIVLDDHNDWVWSIEFSPDGEYLLAGCKDDLVRKWPTRIETMAGIICGKIDRNMDQEEWSDFVAEDIPYEKTCENLKANN